MGAAEQYLQMIVDGSLRGEQFVTAKGLTFTYAIRGNEMFVSRKDKSLTRATAMLAFQNVYPVLIRLGVIRPVSTGQLQMWDWLS